MEYSSPHLNNCILSENSTYGAGDGGGIFCYNSVTTITNCNFIMNWGGLGGGICCDGSRPKIINCTFSENNSYFGDGMYCYRSASPIVTNCIFYHSFTSQIYVATGNPIVSYSDIQGGYPGIGNIDADPLFIAPESQNYRLSENSPCIDAGTDSGAPSTDLEDNTRPQGGAYDIGAYEYLGWPSIIRSYVKMPVHSFNPGDYAACTALVWNASSESLVGYPMFVVLNILGFHYCAPSFTELDCFTRDFPVGLTEVEVIPGFIWPENTGLASGIIWYAFLTNPEMTELVSELGVFDFGWSE